MNLKIVVIFVVILRFCKNEKVVILNVPITYLLFNPIFK